MAKIKIANTRLSFPSLFQHAVFGGESTGKYEATFILDKVEHSDVIKEIQKEMKSLIKEKFKGKSPGDDKLCLKDGDDSDRAEFQGKMTIKGSTKKRPLLLDKDKSPLMEDDDVLYAGCYVNGIVSLWAQDNQFGKRINCSLDGIQFRKDGEVFGDAGITQDAFDFDGDDEDEEF